MPALEKVSANKAFGGQLTKYKFEVRLARLPSVFDHARVIPFDEPSMTSRS